MCRYRTSIHHVILLNKENFLHFKDTVGLCSFSNEHTFFFNAITVHKRKYQELLVLTLKVITLKYMRLHRKTFRKEIICQEIRMLKTTTNYLEKDSLMGKTMLKDSRGPSCKMTFKQPIIMEKCSTLCH